MRTFFIAVAALALTAACADAPITAADLQADGQLRERPTSQQNVLAAVPASRPQAQRAERLAVTGLLASEAEGALEDTTRFSVEGESIHLHLRADDLAEPRPVTFVWTHGDERRETLGFLQPSETLSMAASLPLTRPLVRDPDLQDDSDGDFDPAAHLGLWQVEVYSTDSTGRSLVFEREFEVLTVEAFEATLLEPAEVL
ncbi:hypothetical protein PPSIR1_32118 [Plesiocystis pacifica SIR-1]|uniref:Lipoprotein n=1 Tax=Plesiocystis pacifica SIR-1 TaxID=391625 RepID=A6G2Z1_9BACT|nr:hypothetical protein [Plesiocystis pacifica]EDM79841.1 hypothetical protein PPSIR1_32118 [Plesiocystis pacifica SIR-1]